MPFSKRSAHEQQSDIGLPVCRMSQRREQAALLLQRASSADVAALQKLASINEVESVACECCGVSEDCTPTYIERIKEFFAGKWICGLCSEAVKELMKRTATPEEALQSHMSLCSMFNRTIRLNPKLSLAVSMRDIARKSSERRSSTATVAAAAAAGSTIARAVSCGPEVGC